jgi:olefin beta-lactone synthetase
LEAANVSELFFKRAEEYPGKIAIADKNEMLITFAALAAEVKQTASYYYSKGIRPGDRVLVFVPMGIPLYRCILALFSMGAVAVFLDEWVSKDRLEVCCRLAKCKAFIAPFKLRLFAMISKEMRNIPVWLGTGFKDAPVPIPNQTTNADETALITFTTGSTGIPKAADRTHSFLNAQFDALVDKIQPRANDVDMPVLPIVLLLNLGTGVTSIIADYNSRKPKKIDPSRLWNQLLKHKANRFTASPYVVEQLALFSCQPKPALRIFTGGAPVFPAQAQNMLNGLPGSSIEIVYGSTEAEPISSISAGILAASGKKLETGLPVGKPYRGTQVLILAVTEANISAGSDEELKSRSLAHSHVGEIVVTGKHVLKHYIANPEAEKRNKIITAQNTWHRTGDAGYLDENGDLFLCGRCSTLIYDKKEKLLAPFLWENRLGAIKGIAAGTILQNNNEILAAVETKEEFDTESIKKEILNLYPFDKIVFVKNLPRDPRHFSKVDYEKLKEKLRLGN